MGHLDRGPGPSQQVVLLIEPSQVVLLTGPSKVALLTMGKDKVVLFYESLNLSCQTEFL